MRTSLTVELAKRGGSDALVARVQTFLTDNGVGSISLSSSTGVGGQSAGVYCRLVLNNDKDLISHFRSGAKSSSDPQIQDIVEWLSDNSRVCCLHCTVAASATLTARQCLLCI